MDIIKHMKPNFFNICISLSIFLIMLTTHLLFSIYYPIFGESLCTIQNISNESAKLEMQIHELLKNNNSNPELIIENFKQNDQYYNNITQISREALMRMNYGFAFSLIVTELTEPIMQYSCGYSSSEDSCQFYISEEVYNCIKEIDHKEYREISHLWIFVKILSFSILLYIVVSLLLYISELLSTQNTKNKIVYNILLFILIIMSFSVFNLKVGFILSAFILLLMVSIFIWNKKIQYLFVIFLYLLLIGGTVYSFVLSQETRMGADFSLHNFNYNVIYCNNSKILTPTDSDYIYLSGDYIVNACYNPKCYILCNETFRTDYSYSLVGDNPSCICIMSQE
ncbi:hypothetical protein K9M79_05700 [Candidatus Woesearchaeota archaeon]|nr:hypothetical protein [Candidatus Woesearchaeota archaeon]